MKKACTAILVAAICVAALHAGAFEPETVEPLQPDIPNETETESVLSATLTPGINVLTGDTSFLTFDKNGDEDKIYTSYFSGKAAVESPVTQEGEEAIDPDSKYGKVLALERDMTGKDITGKVDMTKEGTTGFLTFAQTLDADRYYLITWEQYVDYKDAACLRWVLFPMDASAKFDLNTNPEQLASNKWQKVYESRMPEKDTNFFYQIDVGEERWITPKKTTMLYMDNVGVYPYYKINYHNPDGSVTTKQVLMAGGMKIPDNIMKNYTVDANNFSTEPVEKDGSTYRMIGWAQSENASVAESVIPLAGADVDLYPVWEDLNKPILSDETSVHTKDPIGIRFKASVHNRVLAAYDDVEIGFVVARETEDVLSIIESDCPDGLDLTLVGYGLAVNGAGYKKENGAVVGKNYITDLGDGEYSSFTACMIGIPEKYYKENIIVRPYVTIGTTTYYGEVKTESLYNAAKNSSDQDNETIKDIIAKGDSAE